MRNPIFSENKKLVIIMAGLPARGKTFLSLKLQRYLHWLGYEVDVFNVGKYRRERLGVESSNSDFFNPRFPKFGVEREKIAQKCFDDLSEWLKTAGDIAIYDATNVTAQRRDYLVQRCRDNDFNFVFIENICDSPDILDKIIDIKIKNSPDYMGKDQESAKEDFLKRMRYYADVYEGIGPEYPSIKTYNFGERIEKNIVEENGILTDIASFVGSVNLTKKNVYLSRHGETFFNEQDRIGGDSELTDKGMESAEKMADYFSGRNLVIFTSAKIRTIQTGSFFAQDKISRGDLDEINSGICDSMTYKEISGRYPDISNARSSDKFNFCYPGGESYQDLIYRVRKVVADIESQKKDVLIIAHRAVNRCILSYFVSTEFRDIPYIDMPLDTVFKISPKNFEYEHEIIKI